MMGWCAMGSRDWPDGCSQSGLTSGPTGLIRPLPTRDTAIVRNVPLCGGVGLS